ncbi:LuxR C-terminal-related transcriptional regulator [Nocardioides sp. WS12]|uniref:ATP-binding protein n=1 Tax=Nocardioides sp. WS12 TaxID=2486272 RepID=UPI0015F834DE|nr:LuxR C-terminal-related transcriptional regulator [Nocardioides sp. WS12]
MWESTAGRRAGYSLPAELTSFVGRESDLARVSELLVGSRLLTLTGFGGIGKTRLAFRAAADLKDTYVDGVHFVALGAASDPNSVPDMIAATLGLLERSSQPAIQAVIDYLKTRSSLLLLDNCEHLIDASATVAEVLLRQCPDLHILATSREALRIDGEAIYPVASLSLPSPDALDPSTVERFEAIRLFVDRARAVSPDFELTDQNASSVAAVCRKLEGIPLAIELAVARLTTLSPAELDQQLSSQWELLSRGSRTAPHRQSTMAACIEWSFDLCTPAEQELWAKASVFPDGFELDAAKAVCSDPADLRPVTDTLASLIEKSILITVRYESSSRFRMLSPIRHRGLLKLESIGNEEELRRKYLTFYADLVQRARQAWMSERQRDWIHRLRRESSNIREAIEQCASSAPDTDIGIMTVAPLMEFGLIEGQVRQNRRLIERLLAAPSSDPAIRFTGLRAACWLASIQGDMDTADIHLSEAKLLASQLDDEAQALLKQAEGLVALFSFDYARADPLLDEAVRAFRATGKGSELALSSSLLALNRIVLDDIDGALECYRVGHTITEAAGETWQRSWILWEAALAHWMRGDVEEAKALLRVSLPLTRSITDRLGMAVGLELSAWTFAETDPERAAKLLGAAQNEWDRVETSTVVLPGLDIPHQACVSGVAAKLSRETLARATAQGHLLDHDAAIELALNDVTTSAKRTGGESSQTDLTPREVEIAELVRKGLTDRQIADVLVISPRTAETHVAHILAKLKFTSRKQIARWVAELPDRG